MELFKPKGLIDMSRKIMVSIAILVVLSLGSSVLAEHYTFDNMNLIGTIQSGNDTAVLASTLAGETLTLAGKWEADEDFSGDFSMGGWTGPGGEITEATFVWNGSGVITHIVVKASTFWALYSLDNPLNPGDSQEIESEIINSANGKPYAISHISGYTGTTSVPEPATLVLLGLGLIAVPLARKYTS